ncbi:MAG: hypothetical protein H0T46_15315 [Deltaproteobacteria bacterium]|nr:hypothetical protein [Deltaproteobacteria bacterium]
MIDRWPLGPRAELSSDNIHVAMGGADRTVTVVNRTTKASKVFGTFPRELAMVRWSPDGTKLAAVDEAGELKLWAADGGLIKEWGPTDMGLDLVFSNDGRWIMRIGTSKGDKLLSAVAGVPDRDLEVDNNFGTTMGVVFAPGDKLVAAGGQGRVRVYDLGRGSRCSRSAPR